MHQQDVVQYVLQFSYLGIFLWFAFIEQVTPVPEEVSLMSLAYITMHTALNPWISGLVALSGLTVADNTFYYLSFSGNKLIGRLTGKVNSKLLDKLKVKIRTKPVPAILTMGLLPKLRFLSPILAAATGISWKLFFGINLIVTTFYVAVYMLIGIFFHTQLQSILKELHTWQHIIFITLMVLAVLLFVYKLNFRHVKEI